MKRFLQGARNAVEHAGWLTRERLMRWGKVCVLLSVALLTYDVRVHLTKGVTNAVGEQLGGDFINYWSGGILAAIGRPDIAYRVNTYHAFQQSLIGPASEWKLYSYPPILMLLCRPLAGLSYVSALVVWSLVGAAIYFWSLSRLVGWPMALLATVGTPAAFLNLYSGQNGYYTAVLLVWGMALADRRPTLAGILLGTLCYKPQLGVLVPVALIAGGYWRTFSAAAATVLTMVAASAIVLGPESWVGFFDRMVLQRYLMEIMAEWWTRNPTVFAMMRLLGAGLPAAYLAQGLSTISAAAAVAALWHGRRPLAIKCAGLALGTFLATPYAWDYDTVILVFAAAWLASEAIRTAFMPWEKIAVFVLLILPALSLVPARVIGVQIAPVLLWLIMAAILRRGFARPGYCLLSTMVAPGSGRLPV